MKYVRFEGGEGVFQKRTLALEGEGEFFLKCNKQINLQTNKFAWQRKLGGFWVTRT